MSTFIVRVELHSATYFDYERLHTLMAAEGYSRRILGTDGKWYDLPLAEYCGEGSVTITQALDAAKRAAAKVGKPYMVLVSESDSVMWYNLSQATARTA